MRALSDMINIQKIRKHNNKSCIIQQGGYVMKIKLIFFFTLLIAAGCSDSNSSNDIDVDVLVAEVRDVTQSFHNIENAMAGGWDTPLSPCVVHPEAGGMGYHFARLEYLDGRVNHLEPQVLLYEPLENGDMAFVGVEYIVPFEIVPAGIDAPVLFDQPFHANHELGIWALHVWTEKENPSGLFADFNPTVSCEFAND
jgi:hypothetical protein